MKIYLDPGHGGSQPGAIGHDPATVREADLVWAVSVAVGLELEHCGADVKFSRAFGQTSSRVLLGDRTDEANAWPADLFLSIHCNSFETWAARGVEILHYGSRAGFSAADSIRRELTARALIEVPGLIEPRRAEFFYRGLKIRKDLDVLRLTNMPAVLVELPFISNPGDLGKLIEAKIQVRFARAIAAGAVRFLGPPCCGAEILIEQVFGVYKTENGKKVYSYKCSKCGMTWDAGKPVPA